MWKAVVIDDEKIELEGIISYFPWQDQGIEIVGSARNGLEGYQIIMDTNPDIVVTDIKMPVMDGLEMIQKVQKIRPSIHFIILSGYGEYEFMSRAMMLGVRYYILKPINKKKIMKVIEDVKNEILIERERQHEVDEETRKLLSYAKESFLESVLTEEHVKNKDMQFYKKVVCNAGEVRVLVFNDDKGLDTLAGFVLRNIMEELLGEERILMHAYFNRELVLVVSSDRSGILKSHMKKLQEEYTKFCSRQVQAGVSSPGDFLDVFKLYEEAKGLLYIRKIKKTIRYLDITDINENGAEYIKRFQFMQHNFDSNTFLFESRILFTMFRVKYFEIEEIRRYCAGILENMHIRSFEISYREMQQLQDHNELFSYFTTVIWNTWQAPYDKEAKRMQKILITVYQNFDNRDLNLQWLAKEILYMNEHYLGKLFSRNMKVKFSSFILKQRISVSKELVKLNPDISLTELAELTGFATDGKYFCKVFKKITGEKFSDYRNQAASQNV